MAGQRHPHRFGDCVALNMAEAENDCPLGRYGCSSSHGKAQQLEKADHFSRHPRSDGPWPVLFDGLMYVPVFAALWLTMKCINSLRRVPTNRVLT